MQEGDAVGGSRPPQRGGDGCSYAGSAGAIGADRRGLLLWRRRYLVQHDEVVAEGEGARHLERDL